MLSELDYQDALKKLKNKKHLFIDVRSPKEYDEETIPGAINLPIFNNEERALIGTIYKQESKEKAKRLGVDIVSKKLPFLYDTISNLEIEYENLLFFCSRGGYRSSSLVSFFRSLGINANKLSYGYKGYRKYVIDRLPQLVKEVDFLVLYGNTGTGKTHILEHLRDLGMDVLDLEGCANHRGSTLGSIGLGQQNSQKMFESLLFESLNNRKSNIILVEGESRRIGKDVIPLYLFESMKNGINIKITADMNTRVENILKDYVHNTDDELIEALGYLRKYLGNESIDNYIELINNDNYEPVIEDLIIRYYDPLYEHNTRKYKTSFHSSSSLETAENIIKWMEASI